MNSFWKGKSGIGIEFQPYIRFAVVLCSFLLNFVIFITFFNENKPHVSVLQQKQLSSIG